MGRLASCPSGGRRPKHVVFMFGFILAPGGGASTQGSPALLAGASVIVDSTPTEEPEPSYIVTGLIDEADSMDIGDPAPGRGGRIIC